MLEHKINKIEEMLSEMRSRQVIIDRKLDLIITQNRKIMADETKVLADIAAFGDALTSIGNDQTTIAQEIADLKNNPSNGLTPETQQKLDDLATRSTAVATAIHSLVSAAPVTTTTDTAAAQ